MGFTPLVVVVVAVMLAGSALAISTYDNMFPSTFYNPGSVACETNRICMADSAFHNVHRNGLGSMGGPLKNRMNHFTNKTDLNVVDASTPVTSGSSQTDVLARKAVLSPGVDKVACIVPITVGRCDRFLLEFDVAEVNANPGIYDTAGKRWLACHELGHTVGLLHGANSTDYSVSPPVPGSNGQNLLGCMQTPASQGVPNLLAHNIEIINSTY